MTRTLGSLFDGVSGFPLAFSRAGVSTRWVVEIARDCRRVSARHFPEAAAFGDVRDCHAGAGGNLAPVDIITGGFPCTDLSVAGRRAGLAGAHSGLFFEIVRIVREMREATDGARPNYVLLENVPGLYSANARRDLAVVISQLIGLGAVDVGFRICDAQHWGLAQRRRRVFIVVRFGDGPSSAQVLSLSAGGGRDSAPRRETGQGVAASLTRGSARVGGVNEPGRRREDDVNLVPEPQTFDWQAGSSGDTSWQGKARSWIVDKPGRARALTANHQLAVGIPAGVAHALTGAGFDASSAAAKDKSEDGTGRGTPLVPVVGELAYSLRAQGQLAHREDVDTLVPVAIQDAREVEKHQHGAGVNAGGPMFTLDALSQHAVAFHVTQDPLTSRDVFPAMSAGNGQGCGTLGVAVGIGGADLGYTLRAEPSKSGDKGDGGVNTTMVASPLAVRRLTPLECCRLQGYPEWEESVILHVWQNSFDQQKTRVHAGDQSRKWRSAAGTACDDRSPGTAPSAAHPSAPKPPSDSEPADLTVRVNSETGTVALHNRARFLWSASTAGTPDSSPRIKPLVDFVRLVARIVRTAGPAMPTGAGGQPGYSDSSIAQQRGVPVVEVSWPATAAPVSAAGSDTSGAIPLSMSTTSGVGPSSHCSDLILTTLCCSALDAISSFIPGSIPTAPSFAIKLTLECAWLDDLGLSDSQRYRMLGNAIAVPVVEWLARRLVGEG